MADVLSQSEIDALLSALSTGSLEPDELQKEEEKHKSTKPQGQRRKKVDKNKILRTVTSEL